ECHIAWNAVMGIDIPHTFFHAQHLVLVVSAAVLQPPRVVAIEPPLVIGRETSPPLIIAPAPSPVTPLAAVIAVPITVAIAIAVPVSVAVAAAVAIPVPVAIPVTIDLAVGRNSRIGHIGRDAVVRVDILHALFHADDFALVVGTLVIQPARLIAVEAALVVSGWSAFLYLRKSSGAWRGQKRRNSKELFHTSFESGPGMPRRYATIGLDGAASGLV